MNKKLILLILCLPLVLMLSLFSVSNTVKISISVPVSKIEILGDKFVYLDLDKNEKYSVDYAVYPTNAKNKKVYFQTEQVGGYPLAELEYVDGKVVAKSCGKAKVYLTTVDGGFRDSFIVQVDSNQLQSINCVIAQSSIYVGDSTVINTFFAPVDTTDTMLEYQVSDQYKNIVSVSATGVVTGISKGNAEIVVVSVQNPDIKCVVNIEVKNKDIIDIDAYIYCEKDSHKGIVIGKGGAMLKKVATEARTEIESFLDIRINLQCWVKVRPDWRNKSGALRNFGFTEN